MRPCVILLVSLLCSALLPAPAFASRPSIADVAGYYAMIAGGFNEAMSVDLHADGTYRLEYELMLCEIGPNGEIPMQYGEERGTWQIADDTVCLTAQSRTKDLPAAPVFVPFSARKMRIKVSWFRHFLTSVEGPAIVLRRTTPPSPPARSRP